MVLGFFCFKQKTAYEMRISDWSSDVCSSDLAQAAMPPTLLPSAPSATASAASQLAHVEDTSPPRDWVALMKAWWQQASIEERREFLRWVGEQPRSEEHTSELQSLMRISYAVFCLKKKKKNKSRIIRCQRRNLMLRYRIIE